MKLSYAPIVRSWLTRFRSTAKTLCMNAHDNDVITIVWCEKRWENRERRTWLSNHVHFIANTTASYNRVEKWIAKLFPRNMCVRRHIIIHLNGNLKLEELNGGCWLLFVGFFSHEKVSSNQPTEKIIDQAGKFTCTHVLYTLTFNKTRKRKKNYVCTEENNE